MAALPMPPASHQCRKSHCSSKSARWQNWPSCDLTDHHKGSEQLAGTRDPRAGLWRRQPHISPNGAELMAEAAQHLCPAWAPAAAKPAPLLLGQTASQAWTHWASSSHQASSQPQKTCHKLLPCSHPAWPGAQSHWESGPTSHVLHEAWLRVWPEATHEPFAAGPLPLDLTTFSIPNASWTSCVWIATFLGTGS